MKNHMSFTTFTNDRIYEKVAMVMPVERVDGDNVLSPPCLSVLAPHAGVSQADYNLAVLLQYYLKRRRNVIYRRGLYAPKGSLQRSLVRS